MRIFFPYENIRAEQSLLIKDLTKTLLEQKVLLANAPTGLGKTVSSLAPAISCALEKNKKIFFLTPKISQHEIALETIKLINQKFGLGVKAVDLIGKKGLCIDPFLSSVEYGFYDACSKKRKMVSASIILMLKGKIVNKKQLIIGETRLF